MPRGEVIDRAHIRGAQPGPLAEPQVRDQEHIPVLLHLLLAQVTPAAGGVPRVTPRGRCRVGDALVDQPLESGPPGAVDRQDVPQPMRTRAPVAQ